MLIRRLVLNNYGGYLGYNQIDLRTTSDRNIVLVTGQNGSGKTTILNAIRTCLYGPAAYGFKGLNNSYQELIRLSLNRKALLCQNSRFFVEVELTLMEKGYENTYVIKRSWTPNEASLREDVRLAKNGVPKEQKETIDFLEYMRKLIPVGLLDLFFFDGERIRAFLDVRHMKENLRSAVNTIFNLDVYGVLKQDLAQYLNNETALETLDDEQRKYRQLTDEYHAVQEQIDQLEEKRYRIREQVSAFRARIREIENEFRAAGGVFLEERDRLNLHIASLENHKKDIWDEIKDCIANLLPFFLCRRLLVAVDTQVKAEEQYNQYSMLKELLSAQAIQVAVTREANNYQGLNKESLSRALCSVLDQVIDNLKPVDEVELIHEPSPEEKTRLMHVVRSIDAFSPERILDAFEQIDEINKEINKCKHRLEMSAGSVDLANLFDELNQAHQEVSKLEKLLIEYDEELETLRNDLSDIEEEREKVRKNILKSRRHKDAFGICASVIEVLDEYLSYQYEQKLQLVEKQALMRFNCLARKRDFIKKIHIDPASFDIKIEDSNGSLFPIANLSAGESELLMLSILWALILVSGRELPLIFDTLLGRLDRTHRDSVVCEFLPSVSKQLVMLAIDSELNAKHYSKLAPYLASEYKLDYIESESRIEICQTGGRLPWVSD